PVERAVRVVAAQALDERRHGVVVAVAGTVVGEDALLCRLFDVVQSRRDVAGRVAGAFGLGEGDGSLQHVHRRPGIAPRERDQVVERRRLEGDAAVGSQVAGQTALLVVQRAPDGGRHRSVEDRWPRATLRRSGPRSPTRWSWPTNSARVRGRIRAASGWRSGGGWNRASGRAPPARATGVRRVGTPPMVRRRSTYRVNRWRPFTRTSRTARIPSRKPPTRMIRRTSRWT